MFEYTVVEDFTLRLDDTGAVRVFKVGDHITDPNIMALVEQRHQRQVARHYAQPKPDKAPEPEADEPAVAEH